MELLSLFTAFSIGFLGGSHCVGMCGGIMGALTMAVKPEQYYQRLLLLCLYNIGRIVSYAFIAWLVYWLVHRVEWYFVFSPLRYVAGILLILMGLYLANWWKGLVYLEKVGACLWQYIQPLSRSLIPVKSNWQALVLGMLWGWLPCGLIYTALAYAVTASSPYWAVANMLSFGLGTLPAVMLSGLLAERLKNWVEQRALRHIFASLLIIFGSWTIVNAHFHHTHEPQIQQTPIKSMH